MLESVDECGVSGQREALPGPARAGRPVDGWGPAPVELLSLAEDEQLGGLDRHEVLGVDGEGVAAEPDEGADATAGGDVSRVDGSAGVADDGCLLGRRQDAGVFPAVVHPVDDAANQHGVAVGREADPVELGDDDHVAGARELADQR